MLLDDRRCWIAMDMTEQMGPSEQPEVTSSTREQRLSAMAVAIQIADTAALGRHLVAMEGISISEKVKVAVPTRWRHVARTVLSTPLCVAVSWRNQSALSIILTSECVVTDADKTCALLKVLRHVESEVEISIIRQLVVSGATVTYPVPLTLTFEHLLNKDGGDRLASGVVALACQAHARNELRAHVILAVRTGASGKWGASSCGDPETRSRWDVFSREAIKDVIQSGFDPAAFLSDPTNWSGLGVTTFQRLLHVLPLFLQLSACCPPDMLALVIRMAGRHAWSQGVRDTLRQIPPLLLASGYDVTLILALACLSPRVVESMGFNEIMQGANRREVCLADHCRRTIRKSVTSLNMVCATQQMNIPRALREFLLLKDVQPLLWEGRPGSPVSLQDSP